MSHSYVFLVLLCFLIGVKALPVATPSDTSEWATLIKYHKFLNEFKKSIADYQQCYLEQMSGVPFERTERYWTKVPVAIDACNVIAPFGSFEVETINKDDRGPVWYIRPKGYDARSFSMVTVGLDRRDEAAERELRTSIPRVHHHRGEGVALVAALADRYNFSSTGRFHHVGTRLGGSSFTYIYISCFDIEESQSSPPERSLLDYYPSTDMSPIDLLWSDGGMSTVVEKEKAGLIRGYLIFDGKQTDITNICQISVRSLWSEPRVANFTHEARWIPDVSPLPATKTICQTQMSYALRYLWMDRPLDRPFVLIRSGFYYTANNETYFNEFFINVENPKCVAKYLANWAEVGKCEPRVAKKTGRVVHDQVEVEGEIQMIEG